MSRWRGRIRESGAEELLSETIMTGVRSKHIKKSYLERVNVDATVQTKAVRFPTDARLYDRSRVRLVKMVKKRGIKLRQTYSRVSTKKLRRQSGYAKAKQYRRSAKATGKLKTWLGRVIRDN